MDHLVVVDNDDDSRVADMVAGQPISTYLGSRRNLGGAGGVALGMLHALALGADWVWMADDDSRYADSDVLTAPGMRSQARSVRSVVDGVHHGRNLPSRCAAALCGGGVPTSCVPSPRMTCCPASMFNGALFHASTLEAVGVPDLRVYMRSDDAEFHCRLARSGLPFGTCLDAVKLRPQGVDEFKPILGGRMHTQYTEVLQLP